MELTLEGHPSFHTEGTVTVALPEWMYTLPQDEIDEARTAENRDGLILAAGRHPGSGDIVFLTGDGQLREIKRSRLRKEQVPAGEAMPVDFGQTIKVEDGSSQGFEMSNLWAIDNAMGIMFLGAMATIEGTRVEYEYVPES